MLALCEPPVFLSRPPSEPHLMLQKGQETRWFVRNPHAGVAPAERLHYAPNSLWSQCIVAGQKNGKKNTIKNTTFSRSGKLLKTIIILKDDHRIIELERTHKII